MMVVFVGGRWSLNDDLVGISTPPVRVLGSSQTAGLDVATTWLRHVYTCNLVERLLDVANTSLCLLMLNF